MWKYVIAWIPLVVIAIINGALRETFYSSHVGELAAHQLSSVSGIVLFGLYIWLVIRRWRPRTGVAAVMIGLIWLALTISFEFGFGHYARGLSWDALLHDYNLLAGRVWVLVLVWVTVAPYLFYRLQTKPEIEQDATQRIAPLLFGLIPWIQVPSTVQFDGSLPYTKINGYKFHTEIFGSAESTPVIVVHGGPGGDFDYLKALMNLSKYYRIVFYDQRGAGLSPRVDKKSLTLEQNLGDLHAIVEHFSSGEKVKLIGHSWGGMLVTGYLSQSPEKVSQAVIVEPGMLYPASARACVKIMKQSQSIADALALAKYMLMYPFVRKEDGHEGYDYVMTRLLNRNKPGPPYQCAGQAMPDILKRAGYGAFSNMMKPVMSNPDSFTYDLTNGISRYRGDLMMISSECSLIGYAYQEKYHLPKLPEQMVHIKASGMGHNLLTLNPEWSLQTIATFFKP